MTVQLAVFESENSQGSEMKNKKSDLMIVKSAMLVWEIRIHKASTECRSKLVPERDIQTGDLNLDLTKEPSVVLVSES